MTSEPTNEPVNDPADEPASVAPEAPARHRRSSARWRRRGLIGVAVLAVVAIVAQPIRLRAVAAATVADALDLDWPRPFADEVERRSTTIDGLEVDVYGPPAEVADGDGAEPIPGLAGDAEVVIMVPGAAPDGRDDTRLVSLAEAFARSGRGVLVPELEVYQEDLVPEDLERLVTLIGAIAPHHGPVVLAGISFGGSLSLIASADPRVAGEVSLVATFGAYADLAGVLQAAITGRSLVDGEHYVWHPDPRAEEVAREQLIGLMPDEARQPLIDALETEDPTGLPDHLRPAYELLTARDPARVAELVDALPPSVLERLDAVSPVRAAADLDVPIVALHAKDDPVIPYAELHRLGHHYPHADLISLQTFDHVGIDPEAEPRWWVTVRDLWSTTRFAGEVLRGGG